MKKISCLVMLFFCLTAIGASAQQAAQKPEKSARAANAAATVPFVIQVDRVDSKVEGLPAEFSAAIYENLLQELAKSKKFQQVYRSGDKRAAGAANLLTLKTAVEKFQQGSQTTRAVTTVAGATKIFVKMQVTGADGKLQLDSNVEGAVHFFGDNLRATHNLAASMVKMLARKPFKS